MSRLVFLQALLGWSACIVTQSPDVSVMEGEPINITCCWTQQSERLTLSWMKNQTTVKTEQLRHNQSLNCSDLTFKSIKSDDSGNYTCKLSVEIPTLVVIEGNGTLITVMPGRKKIPSSEKENSHLITVGDSHQEELHYNLLRCLPVLALFISFYFLYRLKTKAQPSAQAAPGNIPCSDLRVEEENQEEDESGQRRTEAE